MRVRWVHLAAIVTVLSLLAGCVPVPRMEPSPEARSPATQAPATQTPPPAAAVSQATPAQSSAAAPSPTLSGLLGLVEAFEDAYNRHDVEEVAGLLADIGCLDWGAGPRCGSPSLGLDALLPVLAGDIRKGRSRPAAHRLGDGPGVPGGALTATRSAIA